MSESSSSVGGSMSLDAQLDALADELGRVAAGMEREYQHERDLRAAEHRAVMAEWNLRLAAVADLERRLAERLGTLKDGAPGERGERGEQGPQGERGPTGERGEQGPQGAPGERGDPGEQGPQGPAGERGEPGSNGVDGAPGPQGERGEVGDIGPAGPMGQRGEPGAAGEPGPKGDQGERGESGPAGERGADGAPGKLPTVEEWSDRVHQEGEAVTLDGATYQAIRLTGKAPPHGDWRCIARAGRDGNDGRSLNPRSTWSADETYGHLDVVALDGGAFVALRDDPGPCPGAGWQLMVMRGKPGRPGEKGDAGRGIKGDPGPAVVAIEIDGNGMVTVRNADGTTVRGDFYPVLSQIAR